MADDSVLNRSPPIRKKMPAVLGPSKRSSRPLFAGFGAIHVRFRDPLLWSLSAGEAIMVKLLTAPQFRGRGLANSRSVARRLKCGGSGCGTSIPGSGTVTCLLSSFRDSRLAANRLGSRSSSLREEAAAARKLARVADRGEKMKASASTWRRATCDRRRSAQQGFAGGTSRVFPKAATTWISAQAKYRRM